MATQGGKLCKGQDLLFHARVLDLQLALDYAVLLFNPISRCPLSRERPRKLRTFSTPAAPAAGASGKRFLLFFLSAELKCHFSGCEIYVVAFCAFFRPHVAGGALLTRGITIITV